MTNPPSLCATHSLVEISTMIALRQISPLEVVQDALDTVQRFEPQIQAFITRTAEAALQQAESLEKEWMRGQLRGPLHGIPIGYKDNICIRNVPTTANSRSFAGWLPAEDAEVVTQLQKAGTVSLGKLGLWELAGGAPTPQSLYPPPRNPWALDRSPGGSSSGSAAAVSAGFCLGSIGTDTGGSIRNPAASCGLVGLKPTFGSVSNRGVIPLSKTLDHVGPITRTVADNLLLFSAMRSEAAKPLHLEWSRLAGIRGLRLGVPWHMLESFDYDPACRQAFAEALDVLAQLGAELHTVHLPVLEQSAAWGGEITALDALDAYGERMRQHPEDFDASFTKRILQATEIPDDRRAWLRGARRRCEDEWLQARQQVDVIVTPGSKGVADTLTDTLTPGYGPRAEYTRMYNVSGMPALVMPMGWSHNLPLSIQFAAGHDEEDLLYRVALAYEEATAWTQGRPPALLLADPQLPLTQAASSPP